MVQNIFNNHVSGILTPHNVQSWSGLQKTDFLPVQTDF